MPAHDTDQVRVDLLVNSALVSYAGATEERSQQGLDMVKEH